MNESFFKIGNLPDNFSLMQNCKKKKSCPFNKTTFYQTKENWYNYLY